jgi:hypothetical protein
MTKPIGYYVSVPEDYPDHEILEKIEQEFGSTLDKVGKDTLGFAIAYCASCYFEKPMWNQGMDDEAVKLIVVLDALTEETAFALVPFLHQVICSRGEPKK